MVHRSTYWKDLSIGDEFVDGSVCEEIQDWRMKPCYEIKIEGNNPIVLSNDHLLYGLITINNTKISNFEKSKICRKNVGELDEDWLCVEDIYEMYNLNANISIATDECLNLIYIKPFMDLKPQKVRCISTNTGHYETNGLLHHNTARKLFYCMSDVQVVNDCGYTGDNRNALNCLMPEGHICAKCAHSTQGGDDIKEGDLVGGRVSTAMSEALTQLSMKQKHVGSSEVAGQINVSNTIMATLDGWSTSPVIQDALKCKTTQEMRETIFNGLKKLYSDAGIKEDDFNIQMVARKLTSYKRTNNGIEPIQPGEKADICSMMVLGNKDNIFKRSELSTGYKYLTKPTEQTLKRDAANEILR